SGQARSVTGEHPRPINKALLNPDGHRLLTICHEKPHNDVQLELNKNAVVALWDVATGQRIRDLVGHTGPINDAAFSPDGQSLLTGGGDKPARLWSADSGRPLATLVGHTGPVAGIAFSPAGLVAATLDWEDSRDSFDQVFRVRWWETRQGVQIGPPCSYK